MVNVPKQQQIRPARVYQTITTLMNHRTVPRLRVQKPIWYDVVESIPPSEILTRPLPPQHKTPNSRAKKASRLFQPQQLVYPEDHLRTRFYRDHPWELARPRIIMEMDGKDSLRLDWSRGLRQPGIPLSGESVVQRQLWVMQNVPGISEDAAYDQIRKEFYALRQEEDIERRVATEEATMYGAYFTRSRTQVGMEQESVMYEKWKVWAKEQTALIQSEQRSAYTSFSEDGNDVSAEAVADEDMEMLDELRIPAKAPVATQTR